MRCNTNEAKADNRQRALQRLKDRGVVSGSKITKPTSPGPSSRLAALSDAQRKTIEDNRQRALNKLKEKQDNWRDASKNKNKALSFNRPSVVTSEYIEYDLGKVKDTRGGFLDEGESTGGDVGKTFDEWKEERVVREPAPPMDMENATKCFECGTYEIDNQLWDTFQARVCRRCAKQHPEKYALLTKTECREDYFLTESELEDHALLRRLSKENPHSKFNRMQLFLRYQVEEFAFKRWGGADGLDAEWERREAGKIKRRDKKYELKMKEMRKKTRAEEYNRRIREGKFESHVHDWSQAFGGGIKDGLEVVRRRCVGCGFEVEEFVI